MLWHFLTWLQWRLLGVMRRIPYFRTRPVPMIFPWANVYHLGTPPSWLYKEIFVNESYKLWNPGTPKNIVDLGANVGLAALYFRTKYPSARVYCVEASPLAAERLRATMGQDANVSIEQVAVAREDGTAQMWFDEQSVSQFNSSITGRDLGTSDTFRSITVETKTLEKLIPEHVDLMKVDIEGAEYDVLLAACVRPDRISNIVVEVHDLDRQRNEYDALYDELRRRGYREVDPPPPEPWPACRIVRFDSAAR